MNIYKLDPFLLLIGGKNVLADSQKNSGESFMASQRRRIIGFLLLFVELLAPFLLSFGLYVRFSVVGNSVGSIYILVGFIVAIGGAIPMLFISRQRKDKPK